jgi:ribosome-binding protein aMBF1 (putative translation factor)
MILKGVTQPDLVRALEIPRQTMRKIAAGFLFPATEYATRLNRFFKVKLFTNTAKQERRACRRKIQQPLKRKLKS